MWNTDWPTKAGWYWLYGSIFSATTRYYLVAVHLDEEDKPVYMYDGIILHRSQNPNPGYWQKAVLPPHP